MRISPDQLLRLLPEHYRDRDREGDPDSAGALEEYLEVLAAELAVVDDGVDQLYDDQFVETAAPWVLPYIAELVGLRGLPGASVAGIISRGEVANTIAYRRRKGTAAVMEQVARDVTGWPARAVEYFELLAATQHANHPRPAAQVTASLRSASRLQFVGGPFESGSGVGDAAFSHVPEVRRIPPRLGLHNILNVGIHAWRIRALPVTSSPARPAADGDKRRFLFDPLGAPQQLYTLPATEREVTASAQPVNVPLPIARLLFHDGLAAYYGERLSVWIEGVTPAGPGDLPPAVVVESANLADIAGGWGNLPEASAAVLIVRIDPVRGRIAFSEDRSAPTVSYHRGFSAELGGGEYPRTESFASPGDAIAHVAHDGVALGVPASTTITAALATLVDANGVSVPGTVQIADNHVYGGPIAVTADARSVEIRGADGRRPILSLGADLVVDLANGGIVTLNGLVVAGGGIQVKGKGRLILRHCTLVPGRRTRADGTPWRPGVPSLQIDDPGVEVEVERSILGGIRAHVDADVACRDSIVDTGMGGIAYADAPDAEGPGGTASFEACTVLGRVHARVLARLSNSIVLAAVPPGEEARWPAAVLVDRRQEGCVRFSYVPPGSRVPRRFRGVPETDAATVRPVFTSTRYGDAAYLQLDRRAKDAIWRGADDESELGAFHHLNQPLRERYLLRRLEDYTRFGLEVGLFFES